MADRVVSIEDGAANEGRGKGREETRNHTRGATRRKLGDRRRRLRWDEWRAAISLDIPTHITADCIAAKQLRCREGILSRWAPAGAIKLG